MCFIQSITCTSLQIVSQLQISPPTSLSYLTSQVLFVGSHAGDSQLLRISPTPRSDLDSDTLPIPGGIATISPAALGAPRAESPDDDYDMREAADNSQGRGGKVVKCKGNYIEVLSRFPNIAPIMDAVLADPEESGQVRCLCYRNAIVDLLVVPAANRDLLWG